MGLSIYSIIPTRDWEHGFVKDLNLFVCYQIVTMFQLVKSEVHSLLGRS